MTVMSLGLSVAAALPGAQEAENHGGVPPELIGLGTFIGLVILLALVLMFGKGRPHA